MRNFRACGLEAIGLESFFALQRSPELHDRFAEVAPVVPVVPVVPVAPVVPVVPVNPVVPVVPGQASA